MLKLNLGCGIHPIKEFVNIDIEGSCDIKKDITTLKYDNETVDEIYMSHMLEHLNREDAIELINNCYVWLKKHGRLFISVPDIKKLGKLINLYDDEILMSWIYGDGNNIYNFNHHWGYSENSLKKLLNIAGFNQIEPFEPMYNDDSSFKFKDMYLSINWVCEK
jgi:predicted SAM-dependent methyltransferase